MANIRKSFNLRSGVQVDEDNLLVNSVGNVGLGTTVPTETLDVRGNIKSVGVVTAIGAFISGGLESTGIAVGFWHYFLMSGVSLTTVVSFESVGAILVIAFLSGPPAIAYLLTGNFRKMLILACAFGILCSVIAKAMFLVSM